MNAGDFSFGIREWGVTSVDDIHRVLSKWPPGKPVLLLIVRKSTVKKLEIIPRESE